MISFLYISIGELYDRHQLMPTQCPPYSNKLSTPWFGYMNNSIKIANLFIKNVFYKMLILKLELIFNNG